MVRRDRLELIYRVLKVIEQIPQRKTHIMHEVKLDTRTARRVLSFLSDKGLIEITEEGNVRLYKITERGREFIKIYEKLTELLK